jgi:hypothetical protein
MKALAVMVDRKEYIEEFFEHLAIILYLKDRK